MLPIDIPAARYEIPGSWDGHSKKLLTVPAIHLELEHSLMSISKWESKWKISFIENQNMTVPQFRDYVRCMTMNRQKDPNVYQYLRQSDARRITEYIHDPMSARRLTTMRTKSKGGPSRVQMTSEYFYHLMIQYGIPFDCDKWHFERLLALIDCCSANNGGEKPMSYREKQQFYASLNAQRRQALNSKG